MSNRAKFGRSLGVRYFFLMLFVLGACNPTRRLAGGELWFKGANIEFSGSRALNNKGLVRDELLSKVRPRPNSALNLWIFNQFKEPKKQKGFIYFLKYKIGEPPVLYDAALADRSRLVMQKYLEDQGYLNSIVSLDTLRNGQEVTAFYTVKAPKRYRIREVHLPDQPEVLAELTRNNVTQSFLKAGQTYLVENLRNERSRLATLATQNGYYGVSQHDIYYYIDTTNQTLDSLDLYLRWKPANDSTELQQHYLGRTTVFPSYSLSQNQSAPTDTFRYDHLSIIESDFFVKEKLLNKAIKGLRGDLYDGRLQRSTISYLQDLDIFKFINVRSSKREEDGKLFLDRNFYLTPAQVREVRVDFETNTRSGSYLGILSSVNYTDRNFFSAAERLDLNLSVGAETQLGNTTNFINTLEITAGASLSVPRILSPIKFQPRYQDYVARTHFNLTNAFQIRANFFTINRLTAEMTYDWRTNRRLRHVFAPISMSLNQTSNLDSAFQVELDQNSRLKNSLENVLILGGHYRLTYSTQEVDEIKPYFFLGGNIKLAGNLPNIVISSLSNSEAPYQILGTPFSQFGKIQADARYYLQRRNHTWAFRVATGIVVPYGNSEVAPYSEQFFIGGSTSLRAFRLRQLGPGSFVNPEIEQQNFFDQTGDIKLELNAEYRFDLASYFKGAAFIDAGNIWLLNETIGEHGEGRFQFDTFGNEIAVGAGLGLRLDVSYFVIRLDAAFPLRKPIFGEGFQWVFDDIDLLDKNWRAENLVWHLAIGYPF